MPRKTLQQRFDEKYQIIEPGGCWIWMGAIGSNGYGLLRVGGRDGGGWKVMSTHRVSWLLHHGPIPDGMCVLHCCDVKCCVNPTHLWLGTHADNQADMAAKGRASHGEAHHSAKLTESEVAQIREIGGKMSHREIAAIFPVGKSQVHRILSHESWSTADRIAGFMAGRP